MVREKERRRRNTVAMESVEMNVELAEKARRQVIPRLSPLTMTHEIPLSKVSSPGEMTISRGIRSKWRMETTSWLGHAEVEKPVEISSRVDQICRLLGTAFGVGKGMCWIQLRSKVNSIIQP